MTCINLMDTHDNLNYLFKHINDKTNYNVIHRLTRAVGKWMPGDALYTEHSIRFFFVGKWMPGNALYAEHSLRLFF